MPDETVTPEVQDTPDVAPAAPVEEVPEVTPEVVATPDTDPATVEDVPPQDTTMVQGGGGLEAEVPAINQ